LSLLFEFAAVLRSTIIDVLPIVGIIFGFQFFVIRRRVPRLPTVLSGFACVVLGLALFLLGLEKALFPLGRLMAEQLTSPDFLGVEATRDPVAHWHEYHWIYAFAFAIGFSTTIAEPSLIAVALKAEQVSAGAIRVWGLRIAVAIGVAVGIALGTFRIVIGSPIHWFIIAGYVVVILQTTRAPKMIVPLAYDSGGVTTSTVTVPLVAALGLGLAETVPGRSPLIDGFGLVAFASLFPMMTVMGYAQLSAWLAARAHRRRKRLNDESGASRADDAEPPA